MSRLDKERDESGSVKDRIYKDAYEGTFSDEAAAALVGLRPAGFTQWRLRKGLPPNNLGAPFRKDARFRAAYAATQHDDEAAARLGVARATFVNWRNTNGLKAKPKPRRQRGKQLTEAEHAKRREVYTKSEGDTDAARQLGISTGAFFAWREEQGLPNRNLRVQARQARYARYNEAYNAAANDLEAAVMLGLNKHKFSRWRTENGLPAKEGKTEDATLRIGEERLIQAFETSKTDQEAASKVGLPTAAFALWARKTNRHYNDATKVRHSQVEQHQIDTERLSAYNSTNSDEEAAAKLGIHQTTFYAWRKKLKLPAKIWTSLQAQRRKAYEETSNDLEAAKRLGLSYNTWAAYRKHQGWPPKVPAEVYEDEASKLDAYHATTSDVEAAQTLGIKAQNFGAWRRRRGLPEKYFADRHAAMLEAYNKTNSDVEAAASLGIPVHSMGDWRRAQGLPMKQRSPRSDHAHMKDRDQAWATIYRETRNDEEAANRAGVKTGTFSMWRRKQGLPPRERGKPGPKPKHKKE